MTYRLEVKDTVNPIGDLADDGKVIQNLRA